MGACKVIAYLLKSFYIHIHDEYGNIPPNTILVNLAVFS